MGDHANFPPSAMDRYDKCPAAHRLEQKYPDTRSLASITGTNAHTVLSECVKNNSSSSSSYLNKSLVSEDNGLPFTVTQDMVTHIDVCLHYLDELKGKFKDYTVEIYSEIKSNPGAFIFRADFYGTADIIFIVRDKNDAIIRLEVIDYKNGSFPIDASENLQGIAYLLGVLNFILSDCTNNTTAIFTIVQPKCIGVESWETSIPELLEKWVARFNNIIENCLSDNPSFGPGGKQCQFCSHKRFCDAYSQWRLAQINNSLSTLPISTDIVSPIATTLPNISEMSGEELEKVKMLMPLLQGWFSDVEDEIKIRLRTGRKVGELKLIRSKPKRAWIKNAPLIIKTLTGFTSKGVKIFKRKDVVTEKPIAILSVINDNRLSKKQIEVINNDLLTKTVGSETVVSSTDKGEDISLASKLNKLIPSNIERGK